MIVLKQTNQEPMKEYSLLVVLKLRHQTIWFKVRVSQMVYSLIDIINIGAAHSFISPDCVNKLNLNMSRVKYNMVIETPTNVSTVTLVACFGCH